MTVELNHIIVPAHDKHISARFLADVLGLEAGMEIGPFVQLQVDNGVTLDFMDAEGFEAHHCAFLVNDAAFDAALQRIRATGVTYWADPFHAREGEINHNNGGRGLYFADPGGHNMELLTAP
ncbi:VOC family protein [Actinopolymorpha pittospori]|uniref:Catechol 2,3-dioxygenase-like lactoylglutathione lyase family enzyme n=1 Tax=Actinopolymorpha pittospori TaxID=648752 RepID=A0A927R7U4_9ACTN|nr:VOC family protein [Actinopolymorpha pittospori]MBE1604609.1 catechol 2,3-dioxygenase-like lactoylglutathione lyase family enzyme [Actinopolymorpha pittospori]